MLSLEILTQLLTCMRLERVEDGAEGSHLYFLLAATIGTLTITFLDKKNKNGRLQLPLLLSLRET